jgi:hypothetical protein
VGTALATIKSKPIPYQVSLKQSNPGEVNEHWALHFHPKEAGKGNLHILDATSKAKNKGVLHVSSENKGKYKPGESSTSKSFPIAEFSSKNKAMTAMRDVKKHVKMVGQYPQNNCVDFTCTAVQHMATNGHIDQAVADRFIQHYDEHKDAVRAKTDTPANRAAAGVTPA